MKYYMVWTKDGAYAQEFASRKRALKEFNYWKAASRAVVLDLWAGDKLPDGTFDGDYLDTLLDAN